MDEVAGSRLASIPAGCTFTANCRWRHYYIRAHESAIIQLIRRRVLFCTFFVTTLLKMVPGT
jgi:hypothetical protein